MIRWLGALVLLVAVYLMDLGSTSPWDAAIGAGLAAGVLAVCNRFIGVGVGPAHGNLFLRALLFPRLVLAIAVDVAKGTIRVAMVTLGIQPLRSPGIVDVPIGERSETGIAISSLASTLSPGAFLIDVDREAGVMRFHVLDASDPQKVIDDHQLFYQRYQRQVFP